MMALGGLFAMSVQAQPTTFQPDKHTTVTLALHGQQVSLEIQRNGHTQSRELRVQAEKPLHIELDDFNFDGAGDFAIWHVDDGMVLTRSTGCSSTTRRRASSSSDFPPAAMNSSISRSTSPGNSWSVPTIRATSQDAA
ncbi:hypothetical protein P308_17535 [Pseudomonas piscis]|nr:hypothetical protein P308_17535 [Pseudomonas piscis]